MTYEAEIYRSMEGCYCVFLRQNPPDEETRRNLYIIGTYSVPDLKQFSRVVEVCDKSKGRPREEVKRRIEEILD